jgi:GNAT superfamily N-acetyltransferase
VNLVVRRAEPGDAPLVSSVLAEADAWLRARGAPLWQEDELAPETLTPEVASGLYYVGFCENEPVGVLRLTLEDPLFWPEALPGEAAYVHRLAVRRAWSGGETSRALLAWAGEEALRRGCSYLRLDCVASRPKLRSLYERFGFGYHGDRVVGPYHVARYELSLAAPTRPY